MEAIPAGYEVVEQIPDGYEVVSQAPNQEEVPEGYEVVGNTTPPESDGGIIDTIKPHFMRGVDRTITGVEEGIKNIGSGLLAGSGEDLDMFLKLNPITRPYTKLYDKYISKENESINPLSKALLGASGDVGGDRDSFGYLAGQVAAPGIPDAIGAVPKLFDAVVSPVTSRLINGMTDGFSVPKEILGKKVYGINPKTNKVGDYRMPRERANFSGLTGQSPRGTMRDWFKSRFVQDYRLNPEYLKHLDTAETGVRNVDAQVEEVMQDIGAQNYAPSEQKMIVDFLEGNLDPSQVKMLEATDPEMYAVANKAKSYIQKNSNELQGLGMINPDTNTQNYIKKVFDKSPSEKSKITDVKGTYLTPDTRGLNVNVNTATSGLFGDAVANKHLIDEGFRPTGKMLDGKTEVWNRPFTDAEYKGFGKNEELAPIFGATMEKQGIEKVKGNLYKSILNEDTIKTYSEPTIGVDQRLGKGYGALEGKYVSPEVKASLDMFSGKAEKIVPEGWRNFVNEWKANTVIKNPKSHVNNILGNITTSWYGDVPISDAMTGAKHAMSAAVKGDDYVKAMPNYDEAANVGLFGRTSIDEMINQVTGIESKFVKKDLPGGVNKSNLYLGKDSKAGKKFYEAYRVEDDAFKLSNYNYWRGQGLSPADARAKVEDAIFDYAKQMPRGVNALRDTGAVPFVSWTYKSIPLMAKTLAKHPSKLAGTTAALYGINSLFDGNDDNEIGSGKVRVGNQDINVNQWTPYQEYLDPQKFGSSMMFGGVPQNAIGALMGKDMSFGKPRGITKKNSSVIDDALGYGKKAYDMAPIPGVYRAGVRIVQDELKDKYDRNIAESALDRLFISNKPVKKSRKRKKPSRKRD